MTRREHEEHTETTEVTTPSGETHRHTEHHEVTGEAPREPEVET